MKNEELVVKYQETVDLFNDICSIVDYINELKNKSTTSLAQRNWLIGYRIMVELKGKASDGGVINLISDLSKKLKIKYNKGFNVSNIYLYLNFYREYPYAIDLVNHKSKLRLPWTYYKLLSVVASKKAKLWYERMALKEKWTTRTLQKKIKEKSYYNKSVNTSKKI